VNLTGWAQSTTACGQKDGIMHRRIILAVSSLLVLWISNSTPGPKPSLNHRKLGV